MKTNKSFTKIATNNRGPDKKVKPVDGRSAPGRFGGEKRVQRESEAALKGERWGRDRS